MSSFEIKTFQSLAFKILINGVSKIIDHGTLIFREDGIKLIDTHDGVLVHFKLLSEKFESYITDGISEINVDFVSLQKITKNIQNDDTLILKKEKDDDYWSIELRKIEKNTINKFQIKIINKDKDSPIIPPVEFDTELSIPSEELKKILGQMKFISPKNISIIFNDKLIFTCGNEVVNNVYILEKEPLKIVALQDKSTHAAGVFHYNKLLYCLPLTDLSNEINIYIKNDYPLIIQYSVANLGHIKLVFTNVSADDTVSADELILALHADNGMI